jgi:hypothetical protein
METIAESGSVRLLHIGIDDQTAFRPGSWIVVLHSVGSFSATPPVQNSPRPVLPAGRHATIVRGPD